MEEAVVGTSLNLIDDVRLKVSERERGTHFPADKKKMLDLSS